MTAATNTPSDHPSWPLTLPLTVLAWCAEPYKASFHIHSQGSIVLQVWFIFNFPNPAIITSASICAVHSTFDWNNHDKFPPCFVMWFSSWCTCVYLANHQFMTSKSCTSAAEWHFLNNRWIQALIAVHYRGHIWVFIWCPLRQNSGGEGCWITQLTSSVYQRSHCNISRIKLIYQRC